MSKCASFRAADGLGTNEIMRRTAKSKTCVWRWQERFAEAGLDGLLRDKTRPSRIKPLEHHLPNGSWL
jgi:transposase